MIDITSAGAEIGGSITDVVSQFLDMARTSEIDSPGSTTRQAGLMYELDSLVSDFLDQNQISSEEYNMLEQTVLNSVAEELILKSDDSDSLDLNADDQGNYDAESVMAAVDYNPSDVDDVSFASASLDGFDGVEM